MLAAFARIFLYADCLFIFILIVKMLINQRLIEIGLLNVLMIKYGGALLVENHKQIK